jgi:hypothetical protein
MVKTKIKMVPPGVRRALDVGGPSGPTVETNKVRSKKPTAPKLNERKSRFHQYSLDKETKA